MSVLAEKTDVVFIRAAARAVKAIESATDGGITHEDDVDMCKARRLLRGIIDAGGYRLDDDGRLRKVMK